MHIYRRLFESHLPGNEKVITFAQQPKSPRVSMLLLWGFKRITLLGSQKRPTSATTHLGTREEVDLE